VAPISETDSKAVAKIKGETNAEAAGRRFFAVKFSKSMRAVFPSDDDPKRLDIMRYIGAESGTCNYTGECAATLP
jgi:hypothetical protein